jgi:hypothetical protein
MGLVHSFTFVRDAAIIAALAAFPLAAGAQQVFTATGAAADMQPQLGAFRASLGGALNPNVPGSFGAGRREINWDAVPDAFSAPNAFPGDFFNQNFSPRARGAAFSTPGSGFSVSADDTNPANAPRDFADINPSYGAEFDAFSPQRLFTAIGSTITDVRFFVPGTTTTATTRGFGVVLSDVDLANVSGLQLFDVNDNLLHSQFAPATLGSGSFSFVGVSFDSAIIARARIISGTHALSAGFNEDPLNAAQATDAVAMDDFIYGEPIPAPAGLLAALGGLGMLSRRRR